MSDTAVNWAAGRRGSVYLRGAAWLTSVVMVVLMLLLPLAYWNSGVVGVLELVAAAAICLFPGLIVLKFTSQSTDANQVLFGLLISMGLRLLPPLVICLVLSLRSTGDEYFNFICYLLLFYMVTLALETYLSVRLIRPNAR